MATIIVISSILGGLLLLFLLFLYGIYRIFLCNPKKTRYDEYCIAGIWKLFDKDEVYAAIDKLKSIPYEDLYITSYDGLKLHAYFYENKNSDQYILLFNSFRGSVRRDYCFRAMDLLEAGKNVILIEQRGHGLSEGHTISLGRKEQNDVVSWVKYIQERFGKNKRITVAGTSLGASTVLFASDKLPPEVSIFADSGYSTQKGIVKNIVKRKKLNPSICWSLLYLSALIFGHFRLIDDAAKSVAKSKCRILMVHCTTDTIVPLEMNKELFETNKEHAQVVFFENIQHALAYYKEKEKYKKMFFDFLNKQ